MHYALHARNFNDINANAGFSHVHLPAKPERITFLL
ncbi:Uncharacterised protein [Collinsella intestinalis]|nr:Uncharacterised protein [Collinsella intestinalis]